MGKGRKFNSYVGELNSCVGEMNICAWGELNFCVRGRCVGGGE